MYVCVCVCSVSFISICAICLEPANGNGMEIGMGNLPFNKLTVSVCVFQHCKQSAKAAPHMSLDLRADNLQAKLKHAHTCSIPLADT